MSRAAARRPSARSTSSRVFGWGDRFNLVGFDLFFGVFGWRLRRVRAWTSTSSRPAASCEGRATGGLRARATGDLQGRVRRAGGLQGRTRVGPRHSRAGARRRPRVGPYAAWPLPSAGTCSHRKLLLPRSAQDGRS
ncbi:unnamed protein product [Urochloa humidicola]